MLCKNFTSVRMLDNVMALDVMYSKVNSHSRMLYGLMKNRKFSYCSTSRGLEGTIGKKKKKKD